MIVFVRPNLIEVSKDKVAAVRQMPCSPAPQPICDEKMELNFDQRIPAFGIAIESKYHTGGYRTSRHLHKHLSLMYVVSGRGRFVTDRFNGLVSSDTILVIRSGEQHQMIDEPGHSMVIYVVRLSRELARTHEELLRPLSTDGAPLHIPRHHALQLRSLLRQMVHEQNTRPEKYDLALRQYLGSFLLHLFRAKRELETVAAQNPFSDGTARVREVLQFVSGSFHREYSLTTVARLARLSVRQFEALCRKETGLSFINFLNGRRAERAKELVENSTLPITAIAFEVGYEDLSTFYRAFKKRYGASPRSYRKADGSG